MSKAASRHEALQDFLAIRGYATIEELAAQFDVTPQTVRKDINTLAKSGKVQRFHGGAGLPVGGKRVAGDARTHDRLDVKRRIAALLARHIPDGASVCIDSGTTTEETARALLERKRLRVITNSLNVASICAGNISFEISVASGVVRHCDGGIFGMGAERFIRDFRVDYGILGISGIDEAGNLLEQDFPQVAVAQALIECSRLVFLVADASKFGRPAMARVAHLSDMQAVFTNEPLDEGWAQLVRNSGATLHMA